MTISVVGVVFHVFVVMCRSSGSLVRTRYWIFRFDPIGCCMFESFPQQIVPSSGIFVDFRVLTTLRIFSKLSPFELYSSVSFAVFLLCLRRSVVGQLSFQMHGRLPVEWLGFVNSCGRRSSLEETVIVVPRWFCRA